MKIRKICSAIMIVVLGVALGGGTISSVSAHEQETTTVVAHNDTAEITRLEEVITLLNQLILLMNALKIQQGYAPVVTPVHADEEHSNTQMEEHHAEHAHVSTSTEASVNPVVPHLVIEVEPHNDKTHVHVRYIDKPEDMFFANSKLDNVAGVIEEIKTRTGLNEDVIREALTFLQ